MSNILTKNFSDINLSDSFFNSLREDYAEFEDWFIRKSEAEQEASVLYEDHKLMAFSYFKVEEDAIIDIEPILGAKRRLKIGTFKIDAHGTKLGERFIKRIFDIAVVKEIDEIYITIFEKHSGLVALLKTFGFYKYGTKTTKNGTELVFVKNFINIKNDILKDYPVVKIDGKNIYGLSIYPEFHTRLFSDSILDNESVDILEDKSHSNSIHKIYICAMRDVQKFNKGDILLIYRTKDREPARFRSVISSICVVEEVLNIDTFGTIENFLEYCLPHSIFTEDELRGYFGTRRYPFIIKITYNIAFKTRVTNGDLIDRFGMPYNQYWGVFNVTRNQFKDIIRAGGVNESLIIN